jgi:SAM-dependent methyltransferase
MKKLRYFIWLIVRPLLDLRYKIRVGRLIEDGVMLRYPTVALLPAQFWNGDFNRKEVAACQLALEDALRGDAAGPRLFEKLGLDDMPFIDGQTHWRRLLDAVSSGAIDVAHCAVDVDPSLHIVRGAHWLVLALHLGVPEVRLRMFHKNVPEPHDDAWLAQRGFSAAEITQVNQALDQMLTRLGAMRLIRPDLKALHAKIDNVFRSERQGFGGKNLLYQSCEAIERAGQRPTSRRFEIYGLESVLKKTDRVLDIGCNCGFFALKVAGYAGHVDGIDITPSLIRIGETVRDFLGISNCTFRASAFKDFKPTTNYNLILSFAVHFWLGLPMREYGARLRDMLAPSGLVLLESQDITKLDRDFENKLGDFCAAGFAEVRSGMLCDDGIMLRRFVLLQKT